MGAYSDGLPPSMGPWKQAELETSPQLIHPEDLRQKAAGFGRGKIWTFGHGFAIFTKLDEEVPCGP